jgi:LPXTG-site transpeptidase (sortase) family protein
VQDSGVNHRPWQGSVVQALIWGGVLLLLVGGFLVYPYVSSRLAGVPTTPTADSSLKALTTAATATEVPVTNTPTASPVPTLVHVPTFTPTATALPAIPDRIVISVIDLDAPIVPVAKTMVEVYGQDQPTWSLPEMRAAGWHETSAPLGVPGNTVLNGHNTSHGEVFRDLYTLKEGDEIVIYAGKVTYTYAVTDTLILPEAGQPIEVRIENARYIQPTSDERLTLVTCHPYGSLRNRLIVIAQPTEH